MERFTPAERKEIYMFLAGHYDVASRCKSPYLCRIYLYQNVGTDFVCHVLDSRYEDRNNFPEFFNFEPNSVEYVEAFKTEGTVGGWFSNTHRRGYAERATALYFAAEMCE